MPIEYTDLQKASPDSEDLKMKLWTPQPSSHLLYGLCTLCASLFFIIIIIIIVFRTPGEKPVDRSMEFQIGNMSESLNSKVDQMSQDGAKLMEKLQKLDAAVAIIQGDTSVGQVQSDMQRVLNAISRLTDRIRKLDNGSDDVCPTGWINYQLSCYFSSNDQKSWTVAKGICQAKEAHLVVINTVEEQNFLFGLSKGKFTWIGLTDVSGHWKWVDGTKYESTPKIWIPGQPDEYFGHGLGGGEDCAHLHQSGEWNDDHCSRLYRYICEKNM
ncbi:asialoglycoprotein receptor 1-like isoform X2 [Eleutherodactylus coqui]